MERNHKIRTIEARLFVVLFFVAITLPLVGLLLRWHVMTEQEENRRLAAFPAISASRAALSSFPEKFTAYFNDNFGFRPTLIHLQGLAKLKLFGISTSPRVIVGKDGWLFLSAEYSATGRRQMPAFTDEQLKDWKLLLEGRRDWLARRGIRYVLTVFPRKEVIYPEFLPDTFQPQEESRFDQLYSYLKQHSDVPIIDLRQALLGAKTSRQIYYKTDTHWNHYGGLAAYQTIAAELRKWYPQLKIINEGDCTTLTQRREGDLSKVLGLASYIKEEVSVLSVREPAFTAIRADLPMMRTPPVKNMITENKDKSLPRMVLFGDSAFGGLSPYLPQNLSRFVFTWSWKLDPVLIKAERPDIVIQEVGELYLANDTFMDLSELDELKSWSP